MARSPADGYTLPYGTGGLFSIGPHLYTKLAHDPQKDLAPVISLDRAPMKIIQ